MQLINHDPGIRMQVIIGGSALLSKYGSVVEDLFNDGFRSVDKIYTSIEGGDNVAMAKTAGLSILEFTTALQRFKPDLVVIRGDRFEMLSAAVAAAYLNKMVAHIEGGDVSGTIDESVRHAITKLAHLHFVTNEQSKNRILRMGERPDYVHNVGSLDIEFLTQVPEISDLSFVNQTGVGAEINFNKPYVIVMQHPVTTGENNLYNVNETIKAVHESGVQAIWFWPNIDAGTDDVSKALRVFRENTNKHQIRFIRHLSPEKFINVLKNSVCLVGNSSAGIKECSYLGVPVVNIGTRQNGRMTADNVANVEYDANSIKQAIKAQIEHGKYPCSTIYHQEGTSRKIADILKTAKPYIQKTFYD